MSLHSDGGEGVIETWPSFTDVALSMSAIYVFYLIVQVAISSQTTAVMQEIHQRQKTLREAVESSLSDSIRKDITIIEDGNLQRYRFADWLLFDSGRAELKPTGQEIFSSIGRVFKERAGSFSRIQIEGHTDDRPIKFPFPSNWELSSARATTVVRFLQDHAALDPTLLSANGYSQYQPVDRFRNDEEAKGRNRRVEVVVVYSPQAVLDEASRRSSDPN
jgi:chemotaxis protein MotB